MAHDKKQQTTPKNSQDILMITKAITSIIHKMMKKQPGDRYQSLYGATRNLETIQNIAISLLLSKENDERRKEEYIKFLEGFKPGMEDQMDEFHLPDMKLYGRERESEGIRQFIDQFWVSNQRSLLLIGI